MAKLSLNEGELLPIGFTHGCFTVIADFSAYQQECAGERIAKFEEEKQKFINGEKSTWHNFEDVETFDRYIAAEKEKRSTKYSANVEKHTSDLPNLSCTKDGGIAVKIAALNCRRKLK